MRRFLTACSAAAVLGAAAIVTPASADVTHRTTGYGISHASAQDLSARRYHRHRYYRHYGYYRGYYGAPYYAYAPGPYYYGPRYYYGPPAPFPFWPFW